MISPREECASEEVIFKICALGYSKEEDIKEEASKENEKEQLVRQQKNQKSEMSRKPCRESVSRWCKRSTGSNAVSRSNRTEISVHLELEIGSSNVKTMGKCDKNNFIDIVN